MLCSLLNATKIKRYLFKLIYFVFPSLVPLSLLIINSNQYDERQRVSLTYLHKNLWKLLHTKKTIHVITFLPSKILIIKMVNDWEFKFCFLIFNHYAKITGIHKLFAMCRERKSFQIHAAKLFWIQSFHILQNQLYLVVTQFPD